MRSVSPLLVLMGLLFVLSVIVAFAFAIQKDTASRKVVRRLSSIAMGGLFLVVMNGSLILVGTAPIQTVTVVALVAMPVYLLALGAMSVASMHTIDWTELGGVPLSVDEETLILVAMGVGVSYAVTLGALFIGILAVTDAPLPQTAQMLLNNALCDGLTLVATFSILGAALGDHPKYSIPVAVVLDLIVAGALAWASLYLGVLGTELALTTPEVLWVLVGRAPSGTHIELGPYFWAMHTTFLPTLFYLSVIVLCYVGKLIILPVASVLKRAGMKPQPHELVSVTFAFVAAVFVAIAAVLQPFASQT